MKYARLLVVVSKQHSTKALWIGVAALAFACGIDGAAGVGAEGIVAAGGSVAAGAGGSAASAGGGSAASTGGVVNSGTSASAGGSTTGAGQSGNGGGGNGGSGGTTAGGTGGTAANGGGRAGGDCQSAGFLLCEDFESTETGGIPAGWQRNICDGCTVEVTDAQSHTGQRALAVGAAANGARRITTPATMLGAAHWGRIFYKVELPVPTVFVHSTLVAYRGQGPDLGAAEFRVVDTVKDIDGTHQFLWNVQPEASGEYGKGSSYDWVFDSDWHCAEWYIDGTNQQYRFVIDEKEVTQIAIDNGPGNFGSGDDRTHIPEVFDEVRIGWDNYQSAAPGFVAWLDDLAIDRVRVGCD